jgi:hypothetical protein
MTIAEPSIRALGLWWLPHVPDTKVPGILTYSPTERAELELIGTLRDPAFPGGTRQGKVTGEMLYESGQYGRICGVAEGTSFTLEGCVRIHLSNVLMSRAGAASERIMVDHLMVGAEFEADEPVDATTVEFRLLHLPYWIDEGGITETHVLADNVEDAHHTLEVRRVSDRTVALHNGMTLSLSERIGTVGDGVTESGLRRDFNVEVKGSRREIEDYVEVAIAFQQLVSFGVSRSSTFEELNFHHPDITRPVGFYAQWLNWETRDPQPPGPNDRLFNLAELGGTDGIHRWCALADAHRGTITRVMATRIRAGGYASDKLLNRAAGLEAFDRDTHGQDDIYFVKRMKRLAALAGEPFLDAIGDVATWATRFKAARNAAAHHINGRPAKANHADFFLAEVAYYLFVLCVLRHVQATAQAFERIHNNRRFQEVAQRMQQTP